MYSPEELNFLMEFEEAAREPMKKCPKFIAFEQMVDGSIFHVKNFKIKQSKTGESVVIMTLNDKGDWTVLPQHLNKMVNTEAKVAILNQQYYWMKFVEMYNSSNIPILYFWRYPLSAKYVNMEEEYRDLMRIGISHVDEDDNSIDEESNYLNTGFCEYSEGESTFESA